MARAVTPKSAYRYVFNVCLLHFFTLRLVSCLPLHHPPSFPIPARTQALLVPLSCQLPLPSHLLPYCMVHQPIEPPPIPPYSIMIKLLFYHRLLTPMKTCEPPPCQRHSLRLRPKASPAYARGPAPLALCLGPTLLSPLLVPLFPLTRLMVFYPRLVPPLNKTGLDKTSQDRIRQDPNRQDPIQSAPLPLLLPHDSPTPTLSHPYPSSLSPQRIGWLAPLPS